MRGIELPTQLLIAYLLLHLRFVGMTFNSPVFTGIMAPTPVRYIFAVILTFASVYSAGDTQVALINFDNVFTLVILAVRELIIGLSFGFLSSLPLVAVRLAGEQIGTVMGFSMAQVMDPMTQAETSLIGQLNFLVALWFYFHWNGHLLMIRAIIESIKLVPLGQLSFLPAGDVAVGTWLQNLFSIGMRIVVPFYCALVLSDIGLGFLARTVPQMNIFVVGLPVKVALGFFVLAAVLPLAVDMLFPLMERWIEFALGAIMLWR